MSKKFLVIFLLLLIFTRFYNLDHTARFIWDESSDLVKIHQYFLDKTITLVGPISEQGDKVFGSLTYYLLMPFAILGKFDPLSTALGAAFWGSMTVLLLLYLTIRVNKEYLVPVAILSLIWFPLLETSRWAWNPNFIPFWTILGLIFYQRKGNLSLVLSGILLGLTVHHHYLSIFAVGIFAIIHLILNLRRRAWLKAITLPFGLFASLLPFIIFDLRHPPGLFLTRVLYFNQADTGFNILSALPKLFSIYTQMVYYFTQSPILGAVTGLGVLLLLILDIKQRNKGLIFASAWVFQVFALVSIKDVFNHYLLPGLGFFVIWLIYKREGLSNLLSKVLVGVLIFSSLFSVFPQLNTRSWQSDISSTRRITNILQNEIVSARLKNSNLAVLSSPDPNTYGRRYRDLLLLKDVGIDDKYQYFTSDHLFVVTTSDEQTLRRDPAPEMNNFRKGKLEDSWMISDSPWRVFLFDKKT